MSVSQQEKSRRRRILFNSLDQGTPVDIVQRAIDLLDNEYGDKPEIRYTELVKRLRESIDHPALKSKTLLGRMMIVRTKTADQIGPDPSETLARATLSAGGAQSSPQAMGLTGRGLVFNTLMTQVVTAVQKHGDAKLKSCKDFFLGEILKMKLSQPCGSKLVEWAKGSSTATAIDGDDKELHKIINSLFVWMCGAFGPVEADKILLQAVKHAEQLPDAFEFSPRKFL